VLGRNAKGQLGDGITTSHTTTVQVLEAVASVSVGGLHTCPRWTDGSAWCWGDDAVGEVGDGR
jgi:alpha-tubulin suppressor-like RCC1 family protein